MIIRSSADPLTPDEILAYITEWENSAAYARIMEYRSYYESENENLADKVKERAERGKTPNYFIPTAYYATLVNTMCGYLFQNVVYEGDEAITNILIANDVDIKDMLTGANALAYNRGVEYMYTYGQVGDIKYRFTPIDPTDVTLIYNADIEPELFAAIRKYTVDSSSKDYQIDVIYPKLVETYKVSKDADKSRISLLEQKTMLFDEVPIIVYNTELLSEKSSFNAVMAYIKALDWVVTGNTNELDRIVDALLVLGKKVLKDDEEHMDEWKVLQNYQASDRAEYISKEMSPEFRRYLSELLIQEIHKHSHVIDWYSPDTGLSGAASGKALKTRLFDMDMFSQRIEKAFRKGAEKRIRLLRQVMQVNDTEAVTITYNRTLPSDFEEMVVALNGVDWLTEETKVKKAGLDWEIELERWKAQDERKGIEEPVNLEDRMIGEEEEEEEEDANIQ